MMLSLLGSIGRRSSINSTLATLPLLQSSSRDNSIIFIKDLIKLNACDLDVELNFFICALRVSQSCHVAVTDTRYPNGSTARFWNKDQIPLVARTPGCGDLAHRCRRSCTSRGWA